ncbi:Otopetrin-2 [Orchesella cincta]|uniref:Otopetrin-2 n=1 Tax=Orchesella cincta TaxID=48709 RepID=A0A1D2MLP0_ORCCI|nr:Otopetrin-2 [Orchesella cincta]
MIHDTSLSPVVNGSKRANRGIAAEASYTVAPAASSQEEGETISGIVMEPGVNDDEGVCTANGRCESGTQCDVALSSFRAQKQAIIIPMSRVAIPGPGHCEDRGNSKLWKSHGNHSFGLVLSALYAKLLIVMGIAFPLSEVMSTYIPAAYYDGFYLYLYFGSILFMIWVFGYIVRERATISARVLVRGMHSFRSRKNTETAETPPTITALGRESMSHSSTTSDAEFSDGSSTETPRTIIDEHNGYGMEGNAGNTKHNGTYNHHHRRHKGAHFGSFYLRMGCVAFGVGSMIYSGLEFGQYFELKSDARCQNYMQALTPSVRMIFTFMQMYFIFLSSRMAVFKESLSSQFGLMHMIGTNLCVWLNVLVQETKHEILHFYDPDNKTISFKSIRAHQQFSGQILSSSATHDVANNEDDVIYDDTSNLTSLFQENYDDYVTTTTTASTISTGELHQEVLHRVIRGLKGPYSIHECGRTNIIGSIVQDAAPFLFPCTIEYSLICAAVCYVMWKNMAKRKSEKIVKKHSYRRAHSKTYVPQQMAKSPHHYTVDCAASHKGLFLGIFVLVLTIMSLIINFVLVKHPDYRDMANLEAHITEIVLYTMATCAVIIGMCQVRALRYSRGRNLELDNILLIWPIYFEKRGESRAGDGTTQSYSTAVANLVYTRRFETGCNYQRSSKEKAWEGGMWLINALEKSRGESHPAQLQFYGVWAWTIITHISMPLAIFYRFHSTVCLCEIWKRAYKIKHVVGSLIEMDV